VRDEAQKAALARHWRAAGQGRGAALTERSRSLLHYVIRNEQESDINA